MQKIPNSKKNKDAVLKMDILKMAVLKMAIIEIYSRNLGKNI
jgi:hypothetical protein